MDRVREAAKNVFLEEPVAGMNVRERKMRKTESSIVWNQPASR